LHLVQGTGDFQNPNSGIGDFAERNVRFGVREHGMGAITNGFALHNVSAATHGLCCMSDLEQSAALLRTV
jgi:transketolase